MNKFPLLDQLRAERHRHEDEITEPFRQEISRAYRMIDQLQSAIRTIESALGTEIGKQITAMIADQMSAKVRQMVFEASAKAARNPVDPITLTLSAETLRLMDPLSLENEILRRYSRETMPALRLRVNDGPLSMSESLTIVDIRIPELGYRHAMAQMDA